MKTVTRKLLQKKATRPIFKCTATNYTPCLAINSLYFFAENY